MSNKIVEGFAVVYETAVTDVLKYFTNEKLRLLGRHNPGWGEGRMDANAYLRASAVRCQTVLELAAENGAKLGPGTAILDVGGFMGAFPLALARLGLRVTLAEKYGYYYGAFHDLREFLVLEGVETWETDFTEILPANTPCARFDLVTCMAVVEHLANSPKILMDNMREQLTVGGRMIVEVPNIAYWPKRLQLLLGKSVLPELRDVYDSDTPFVGHHREYTLRELLDLMEWTGLDVLEYTEFNYTPWPHGNWKQKLLLEWPVKHVPSCGEILAVCGAPSRGERSGGKVDEVNRAPKRRRAGVLPKQDS